LLVQQVDHGVHPHRRSLMDALFVGAIVLVFVLLLLVARGLEKL
jgi:hypothetical protein